jgi:hypothetical protein
MKYFVLFSLFFSIHIHVFAQDSTINAAQSQVLSILNKVQSENRTVTSLCNDSSAALPFGLVKTIGTTEYIIAIDSARFGQSASFYSAYMAMELPNSDKKICFAAKNIGFNPKGVMPGLGSRLVLVSEHRIAMGPKVTMVLKPDGSNYVEWNCNGFQAVNLKGYFEFEPATIYPDPDFSNEQTVKASFEIHVNDIHNLIIQTTLAPFCVRGLKDMSFTVLDATADFSDQSNAPNMVFPQGYNTSNLANLQNWNGFYMRQFRIKLPREMAKNGQRPEILASNMLIDNSGVSGIFQATNLFSTKQGSMSGWGFSINQVTIGITSNHLNGAGIGGYIMLPISLTDSLAYTAALTQNTNTQEMDYAFTIASASNINANVLSARMTLYNTSQIAVVKQNGKLKPQALLNGEISLVQSSVRAANLGFQSIDLRAEAPILRGGIFSLSSTHPDSTASNKYGGFDIGFNSITMGLVQNNPAIAFNVGLNLMSEGNNTISIAAGFTLITKTTTVADQGGAQNSTKPKMDFDRVRFDDVAIAFNSGPFDLNGVIKFKDNDPIYGKGFYGDIGFRIEKLMSSNASAHVWFGKVNNYRYFYVDAAIPVKIPIPSTGVSIYKLMGGIYYHMQQNSTQPLETQLYGNAFGNAATYIPNNAIGLGIKAGVTLGNTPTPKTCNGDVALEINFNANGGMNLFRFTGNVFFMTDINERLNRPINQIPIVASMILEYDFQNLALHAAMGAQVHLPAMTGNGTATMHFDPSTWYIYIGRPNSRIQVSVAGIANFNAYFEVGNLIDPIPPPPPNVMSIIGNSNVLAQRNTSALEGGSGFAFGAGFGTGFHAEVGSNNFNVYADFAVGAGFDLMVLNYGPNAHCANSSSVVGINGWYGTGQLYAYLQGDIGIAGRYAGNDFDFTILSLSAAAVLQARLPNPNWVAGAVAVEYDILGGIFHDNVTVDFEAGTYCNVVQN